MTGILTLGRPKAGVVSTFDAREYSFIDFLPIEYQWTALVQVGLTLRIVFSDGSVIELLNFYSFSLAGDSSGDDHTGALADASGELLVLTSVTGPMSVKEFARTYWTTKSSGYVAVPAFEGHDGEQASGGLTGQNAPDNVPLSFPPPPSASGGVEFPLPPVPPTFFLPPQVTHPPNNAALITGDTAGSVVEAGGVTNARPGVPVASGDLDATDVDGPADSWNAVGAPTPSTNGYGTFIMTASGVWTYTLNNSNAVVEALAAGATLNDSFTVTAVDGSSQRRSITITGANDAPLVTGAVGSGVVTEGPLPVMAATGTIDFGDVDLADTHVTSVTPGGSGYLGTFVADVTDDSTGAGSGQVTLGVSGQQSAAAVAPKRPATGADLHCRNRRRPRRDRVAARDDHHPRHQRRRGDQRRHDRRGDRSRRRQQRHPWHADCDRRPERRPTSTIQPTPGRRLRPAPPAPAATAATR